MSTLYCSGMSIDVISKGGKMSYDLQPYYQKKTRQALFINIVTKSFKWDYEDKIKS
jgi:hypothetical protein